jgi:hypothetical protein
MKETRGLEKSIKKMYLDQGKEITDKEAEEASYNLIGFFKLLIEIDREKNNPT